MRKGKGKLSENHNIYIKGAWKRAVGWVGCQARKSCRMRREWPGISDRNTLPQCLYQRTIPKLCGEGIHYLIKKSVCSQHTLIAIHISTHVPIDVRDMGFDFTKLHHVYGFLSSLNYIWSATRDKLS